MSHASGPEPAGDGNEDAASVDPYAAPQAEPEVAPVPARHRFGWADIPFWTALLLAEVNNWLLAGWVPAHKEGWDALHCKLPPATLLILTMSSWHYLYFLVDQCALGILVLVTFALWSVYHSRLIPMLMTGISFYLAILLAVIIYGVHAAQVLANNR